MSNTAKLGKWGEKYALAYLKQTGHKYITSNYRFKRYEIDLITIHANTIVFTEVKTRAGQGLKPIEYSVNAGKKKFLKSAAKHFIRTYNKQADEYRFDIITIILSPTGKPILRHIPKAF